MADDLAAWLDEIWKEREKACHEAQSAVEAHAALAGEGILELRWMLQLRKGGVFQGGWDMPGPPTPAEDLARIAADRQILDVHGVAWNAEVCTICHHPHADGETLDNDPWPCQTVRLLALPYADRQGYRDEWRTLEP